MLLPAAISAAEDEALAKSAAESPTSCIGLTFEKTVLSTFAKDSIRLLFLLDRMIKTATKEMPIKIATGMLDA